jgi:hypothetical protein
MQVQADSNAFGEVTSMVSPKEIIENSSVISFRLSLKKRENDYLPSLRLIVYENNNPRDLVFEKSTIGFEERSFCVRPGEVFLIFKFAWGSYSNPYMAVDNVTITEQDCVVQSNS